MDGDGDTGHNLGSVETWDAAAVGRPLVVGDAEGNVVAATLGAANTVLASNGIETAPGFKTVPAVLGGPKKVTGSKGSNAALTSLIEGLTTMGLITNETT